MLKCGKLRVHYLARIGVGKWYSHKAVVYSRTKMMAYVKYLERAGVRRPELELSCRGAPLRTKCQMCLSSTTNTSDY